MDESKKETSTITAKKTATNVASYIWNSPCLKPLIFNPFLVALLIVVIIWGLDLAYGKQFADNSAARFCEHIFTTYFMVAAVLALNNMLVKHNYRVKKNDQPITESDENEIVNLTTEYGPAI